MKGRHGARACRRRRCCERTGLGAAAGESNHDHNESFGWERSGCCRSIFLRRLRHATWPPGQRHAAKPAIIAPVRKCPPYPRQPRRRSPPSPPSTPTTCCTARARSRSTRPAARTWRRAAPRCWAGPAHLVAEDDGQVLGFAYCNWFKPRPPIAIRPKDSVGVALRFSRGLGLGRLLPRRPGEAGAGRGRAQAAGRDRRFGQRRLHRPAPRCRIHAEVGVMRSVGWKFRRLARTWC